METHVFNENKKCLDPIDNRCMCCGKGFSGGEEDTCYVPLFKEKERTNLLVYRNVKFSQIDVGVPVCAHCRLTQKRTKRHALLYSLAIILVIALVSVILGVFVIRNWLNLDTLGFIFAVLGIIAGTVIGIFKYEGYIEKILGMKGILTTRQAVMQYGIVEALISDGWTFNQPMA
jgi:hypothetical protein